MTGAQRRQNWTAGERLLKLVEAGKSWVFISANLKRPEKSARVRLGYLLRKAIKLNSRADLQGPGLKAKGK